MSSAPKSSGSTRKPVGTLTIQGSHLTYHVSIWAKAKSTSCVQHVNGSQLTKLLRGKTCTLTRQIGTTTANGKQLGIEEDVLRFGGSPAAASHAATQVAALLTSSPHDGVIDLLEDGKRLPSGPPTVPATAARNAVNNAATVKIVRAWYLAPKTPANDPRLNEAVEDLSAV